MSKDQEQSAAGRRHAGRTGVRLRHVVVAAGIIGVVAAPVGVAATGGGLREGVRNGTTTKETQIIGRVTSVTTPTGGYVTRQSNLSGSGGGAIYGCRTGPGGSTARPPRNPCVRGSNIRSGLAFEFDSRGAVIGTFTAGAGGDTKKPFTTNATGVATGLNADRVDGFDAAQLSADATTKAAADATAKAAAATTRWALVDEQGRIVEQSGGFTVASFGANANVYLNAGSSLIGKGLSATIAAQNKADVDGDGVDSAGEDNFNGEVSVARCNSAAVACAPDGTNNDNTLVVRASNSDGTATTATTRKRFYVEVTG